MQTLLDFRHAPARPDEVVLVLRPEHLVVIVDCAHAGRLTRTLDPAFAAPDWRSAGLTRRELEVARLVARGFSNREVAEALVVTPKTAKNHVHRILDKLGVRSRSQIIARANEFGRVTSVS
jgi:DNA-binding NarL/FixJ family response regulator